MACSDIKEHVSLLVKHCSDITGGHDGVIHLIPEAIASLDVAKVVASMTIKTSVHQHSIQNINNWLSIGLRHIGPDIKVLRIFHILSNLSTGEVGKALQ